MVDLQIPRQRPVFSEAPQNNSGQIMQQGTNALSRGLKELGADLESIAVPMAQKAGERAGQDAISIGPDGKITIDTPATSFIMGKAGEAYAAAKEAEVKVAARTQVDQTLAELRLKHQGNPAAFQEAAAAYLNAQDTEGEVGRIRREYGMRVANQHYVGEINARAARDVATSDSALVGREGILIDRLSGLAREGGTGSDEFVRTAAEIRAIRDQRAANPLIRYSPDMRAVEDQRLDQQIRAEAIVGVARRKFLESGNPNAVIEEVRPQLANLGLSPADQQRFESLVIRTVSGASAARAEETQRLREEAQIMSVAMQQSGSWDDRAVDGTIAALRRNRAFAEANTLASARQNAELTRVYNTEGPAAYAARIADMRRRAEGVASGGDRAQTAVGFLTQSGLPPVAAAALVGNFVAESGLRTDARNPRDGRDGSDSIGISQWNSTRAEGLKRFAAARGTSWTDLNTQLEFALEEMRTTERGTYDRLLNARTVDEATEIAIGFFRPAGWTSANPRGGHNFSGRLAEAQRVLGGGTGSFDPVMRQTIQTQTQFTNNAAREALKGFNDALAKEVAPDPEDMRSLEALAPIVTDAELRKDIAAAYAKRGQMADFERLPASEQRRVVDGANVYAQSVAPDAVGRQVLDAMRKSANEAMKAVMADPVSYGMRDQSLPAELRVPRQIDFAQPGGIASVLGPQQRILDAVRSRDPQAPQMALTEDQTQAFKSAYQNATPDERARMLGEMAQSLRGDVLTATLSKIVERDESANVMASAGVLMSRNPALARSVIRGEQAMNAGVVKIDTSLAYRTALQELMPANMLPARQRSGIEEVVRARYADLSVAANDTSGQVDARRLRQAVNDVTGGVINWGGHSVLAPWPGATYGEFRQAVRSLTDADISGAVDRAGNRIDLTQIQRTAKFFNVGDGVYGVFFGSSPDQGWVQRRNADGSMGLLTVNLAAKRAR